jgi:hypothetical protein
MQLLRAIIGKHTLALFVPSYFVSAAAWTTVWLQSSELFERTSLVAGTATNVFFSVTILVMTSTASYRSTLGSGPKKTPKTLGSVMDAHALAGLVLWLGARDAGVTDDEEHGDAKNIPRPRVCRDSFPIHVVLELFTADARVEDTEDFPFLFFFCGFEVAHRSVFEAC